MSKDIFDKYRDAGALIYSVHCDSDLCEEVAQRLEGRRDGFAIPLAVPFPAGGRVMVAYETQNAGDIQNYRGPVHYGNWPMPLAWVVAALQRAIRTERDGAAERRRLERDRQNFERDQAELQRRGVLFADRTHNTNATAAQRQRGDA